VRDKGEEKERIETGTGHGRKTVIREREEEERKKRGRREGEERGKRASAPERRLSTKQAVKYRIIERKSTLSICSVCGSTKSNKEY
jgi:hypothetical protein